MKFIEVCAISKNDINILNKTNIDRIQIIANPKDGGFTPSISLIEYAAKHSKKKISIFLRCNTKRFIYNKDENKILLQHIKEIHEIDKRVGRGVFVAINFGYLNENNMFLKSENKKIVKAILPYNAILNHAVDNSDDYHKTIKMASKLGFVEILSNGNVDKITKNNGAIENLSIAKGLKQLMILCGGGLNSTLIKKLFKANLRRFHVGSAVRYNQSWKKEINPDIVNNLK